MLTMFPITFKVNKTREIRVVTRKAPKTRRTPKYEGLMNCEEIHPRNSKNSIQLKGNQGNTSPT